MAKPRKKKPPTAGQSGWNPSGSYAKPTITPPAPYTPQPYAPYMQAESVYNRDMPSIDAQERQGYESLQRSYGYDASGGYGHGDKIDPTNPFSRASLLRKSYQQSQRGTGVSMAARGQLYSGALQSALQHGTQGFNAADNAQKLEYGAQRNQIGQNALSARNQLRDYLAGAQADAAQYQAANPPPAPQAPTTSYHPLVQKNHDLAARLWGSGQRTGKTWGDIISRLGYDPRPGKPHPPGAWHL